MEFGKYEEERRRRGLTYQQLADATQVSVSTLQRYCQGNVKSPSLTVVEALNKALKIENQVDSEAQSMIDPILESHLIELEQVNDEHAKEIERLEIERNKQVKRIRLEKYICAGIAITLAAILIGLLLYDYSHPTKGWIQRDSINFTET